MRSEDSGSSSLGRETDGDGKISAQILQQLKPRERDVLYEFGAEPNVKRIARRLGLSQKTVVNYLTSIQQHLRVSSQAELMKLILTYRPPEPPPSPARELGDFHIPKHPKIRGD